MSHPSLWSLLAFTVWTLLIVLLGIGAPRIAAVLARQAPPKSFAADVPHGSDRYRRTMRAHVNCVENLPVFAVLVLLSRVTRLESSVFEALAVAVTPARLLQTSVHIASGTNRAVLVRFWFFIVQLVCFFGMALLLALGD